MSSHRARRPASLLRSGAGSIGLRLGNVLLSLLTTVVLARILRPDGYGDYSFVFAWVTLLAIPAQLGLPTLLVREVAKYQLRQQWGLLRGLLVRANQAVFAFSLLLLLLTGALLLVLPERPRLFGVFLPALALVPLISLGLLRGAALRGLRYVLLGQLPEFVLRPAFFLALLLGFVAYGGRLDAAGAMVLHGLAALLAFAIGALLLFRLLPRQVTRSRSEFHTSAWMSSAIPLSLLSAVQVVNSKADIVMVGMLGTPADVGIYRVAVQAALFVALAFNASTMVLGPHFSRLYARGDLPALQALVTKSTRAIALAALPIAGVLIVFGGEILDIMFGREYMAGAGALAVLAAGHLFGAFVGPVASLLNMTGHERLTVNGVAISAGINIVLNLLLIPLLGIVGAAVATASSLAVWNVILAVLAYRHAGVMVSLLGARSSRG